MTIVDFITDKRFSYGFAEMFISKMYGYRDCLCSEANPRLYKLYSQTVERIVQQFPLPSAMASYIMLLTGCRHSEIGKMRVLLSGKNTKIFIECPKQYFTRQLDVSRDMGIGLLCLIEYVIAAGIASRGEIANYVAREHCELRNLLGSRHNNAAHAFRHLHVSVAVKLSEASEKAVCNGFGWSSFDLVNRYSVL